VEGSEREHQADDRAGGRVVGLWGTRGHRDGRDQRQRIRQIGPNPTVALLTVTIAVAMGITTLWSVRLHLARNQILAMLAILALTWVIFMVVQTPLHHRLFDPR
jgi:Ca2+/H+ antiporter